MSQKLGAINYGVDEGYQKSYSQKTNRVIDQEISGIINERYFEC